MLGYVYLGLAIVLELIGATSMKLSNGFSHMLYNDRHPRQLRTLLLLSRPLPPARTAEHRLRHIGATWAGLGIVLAAAVAFLFFHETVSGLLGILLIIIGVVLCNFFGAAHG